MHYGWQNLHIGVLNNDRNINTKVKKNKTEKNEKKGIKKKKTIKIWKRKSHIKRVSISNFYWRLRDIRSIQRLKRSIKYSSKIIDETNDDETKRKAGNVSGDDGNVYDEENHEWEKEKWREIKKMNKVVVGKISSLL